MPYEEDDGALELKYSPLYRDVSRHGIAVRVEIYRLAGTGQGWSLEMLLRLTSTSNVLLGTDFPHAGEQTLAATLSGLESMGLAELGLAGIKGGNARRLFSGLAA